MKHPEQRLWTRVRNAISGPSYWLQRVENGLEAGMPDIHCVTRPRGLVTWIETKSNETPARKTTPFLGEQHGLNVHQINWHLKCASMHGRSAILIGATDNPGALWLLPGAQADAINRMTADALYKNAIATNWESIMGYLK